MHWKTASQNGSFTKMCLKVEITIVKHNPLCIIKTKSMLRRDGYNVKFLESRGSKP